MARCVVEGIKYTNLIYTSQSTVRRIKN